MANVKITDLTAATTPLAGTELFETVQGGSSKKVAIGPSIARITPRACSLSASKWSSGERVLRG